MAVGALALRDVRTLRQPAAKAIRDQLRLLARLTPTRELSLWALEPSDKLTCADSLRGKPSPGVREAARRAARGRGTPAGPRRTLVAYPVSAGERRLGALAGRAPLGSARDALTLFAAAEPLLASVLERQALLDASDNQAAVIMAAERRVARFGFDLHDGPTQAIAALLSDLRLFAAQLRSELADHPQAAILTGRVQDLELRTLGAEAEIREMARTAGGAAMLDEPIALAIGDEIQAFANATGVVPSLEVRGPVDEATLSQRITVLRAAQEALRNARKHAAPSAVSVLVEASPSRLVAEIEDHGRGFDVRRALARSRREGRVGLFAIAERARLLGGDCQVNSKPGGPTLVRISLPRWKP